MCAAHILKTNLTHYFFIIFSNNANSDYKLPSTFNISDDADIAHQQGADSILECLQLFLVSPSPGPHIIEGNPNPSVFKETKNFLEKYLIDKLGEDHQCLFHLNEHRKMFPKLWTKELAKIFP